MEGFVFWFMLAIVAQLVIIAVHATEVNGNLKKILEELRNISLGQDDELESLSILKGEPRHE